MRHKFTLLLTCSLSVMFMSAAIASNIDGVTNQPAKAPVPSTQGATAKPSSKQTQGASQQQGTKAKSERHRAKPASQK